MASYLKEDTDRLTFYRVQALQSLSSLVENSDLGNEPDLEPDTRSFSFISMPAGYQNPGNLHA